MTYKTNGDSSDQYQNFRDVVKWLDLGEFLKIRDKVHKLGGV